jgi:GDP-4-dehydro-6-deoxy-D-mannose reductase
MKALITGINGFVGGYLLAELFENGYDVTGLDIKGGDQAVDLLDKDAVGKEIGKAKPDVIFHLAGMSSVGASWEQPQRFVDVNVKGTINLLEAVRAVKPDIRVLIVGSSDEYGKVRPEDCPIKETLPVRPVNPYAISKLAQENFAVLYARAYDMQIVLTRSFNHTGPGQRRGFVIPDFCERIVKIERGADRNMGVGNLGARRDFSDVRDVVRAYRVLIERGRAGEVYNVGAGSAYDIGELLTRLTSMSEANINVYADKAKMRPVELPLIQSDISRLAADTGYKPRYDIMDTLRDTLEYWRSQ